MKMNTLPSGSTRGMGDNCIPLSIALCKSSNESLLFRSDDAGDVGELVPDCCVGDDTRIPIYVNIGSVNPPNPMVVKTTSIKVVDTYIPRCSNGIPCAYSHATNTYTL